MTAYELLDLRRGYAAEAMGVFRFWVSVTFALLVAAHVASADMGLWGAIAATTLYLTLTAVSAFTIRRFGSIVAKLVADISALSAEAQESSMTSGDKNFTNSIAHATIGILCIGSVGAIAYVYYRAGFFG